jgi:peroxiredoxin Q/BCP
MRLQVGSNIKEIELPEIDGSIFNSESLKGKPFMLSFLRFASCPFCNLRLNQLVKRFDEFGNEFTIVAIFDSPLDNLRKHTEGHKAPFPILADESNKYYSEYGIEHSLLGMLKGMFFRMPTLIRGMMKGYIPVRFKGSIITMPADFLIDRDGIIQMAYYGNDEGDHLPFEEVKKFSLK